VGAARVVAVGQEAATRTAAGRGRFPRSGLAVLAAVAFGVAVLAVVDRGSNEPEDESAPTRRADATRPTLAGDRIPVEAGPAVTLPGETGMRVVTFVAPTSLEVTDLDSGEQLTVADGAGAAFSGGVARAGGMVTVIGDQVVFIPSVEPGGEAVRIDMGSAVFPSDLDDRVWVMNGEGAGATDTTVREIDLTGLRTGETTELPEGVTPIGGVTGGLVLDSPDGVFLLDRDGNARRVANGSAVGAFGSSVVHRACDDALRCSLYVTDVSTGERRHVTGGSEIPPAGFAEQGVSPDGRLLFSFSYAESGTAVTMLDLEAGEVAFESGPSLTGFAGGAVWSPDGRWLFWIDEGDGADGSTVEALRAEDWQFFELDIPGGYGLVVLGPAQPS
jgi:hypothetical protein